MKHRLGYALLASLPAIFAMLTIAFIMIRVVRYNPVHEIHVLRDNWDITCNGQVYPDRSLRDLPDILPETMNRSDVLSLSRTLDMENLPSPTISLIVYHFAVEAFLDDVPIADYAMDKLRNGSFVGGNRYYINLPADFSGKRLTLHYHFGENHAVPYIYTVQLGSFHDLVWTFLNQYGYVLVIGVFLCFFGTFFLIFSLFFSILLPEVKGQRVSSVLCLLFGVWILTHYRVFSLLTGTPYTMTIEYCAFYLTLPLLYYLIIQIYETDRVYRIIAGVNAALVFLSFLLHFTNLVYMHRFRNIYFAMCSLYLFIMLAYLWRVYRKNERNPILLLQLIGPTLPCIMIFVAMIVYLLSGGDSTEYTDFSVVLLCTGPLLFAIIRFLIYIRLLVELSPQKLEFSSLNSMAYRDALTGLNNRMLMEERFRELAQTDSDYCLVSLDLNGLKLVNDTIGHAAGDRLLIDFANVLRASFPPEAETLRIGGDEFLVIWKEALPADVTTALHALNKQFSALDAGSGIIHSAAHGYAFSHEQENATPHTVYLEADRRMYIHKQETGLMR